MILHSFLDDAPHRTGAEFRIKSDLGQRFQSRVFHAQFNAAGLQINGDSAGTAELRRELEALQVGWSHTGTSA